MARHRSSIPTFWATEYDDLREIIHRRPSTKTSPPSLIRHRSWWLEPITQDSTSNKSKADDYRDLEAFFNILKNRFSVIFPEQNTRVESPARKTSTGEEIPKRQYIIFSGYWLNMYSRYIISLHDERVSLTQINDIGYQRQIDDSGSPEAKELHAAQRAVDIDKEEIKIFQDCRKALERVCESASRHKKLLATYSSSGGIGAEKEETARKESELAAMTNEDFGGDAKLLFYEVWNRVDDRIPLKTSRHRADAGDGSQFGVFADFRAILLPADFAAVPMPPPRHRAVLVHNEYDAEEAVATVGAIWPFFRSSERGTRGKELTSKDVIACLVQGKSAIYISTMGNSPLAGATGEEQFTPVKYLMISASTSRWFNGRLIDTMNRLGVYRLIALRDNGELRKAGMWIKKLGSELDGIAANVLTNIEHGAMEKVRSELGRFFRSFQSVGASVDGGLQYRTYRSTTYSDAFRALLDELDVHGIAGFQRYDNFVKKQVFGIFKYIESLGDRVQQLRERYLSLVNYVEMHDIGQIERDRNEMLRKSENLEIIAGAYYISYALVAIVGGLLVYLEDGSSKDLYKGVLIFIIMAICAPGLYFLFHGFPFFHRRRDKHSPPKRTMSPSS